MRPSHENAGFELSLFSGQREDGTRPRERNEAAIKSSEIFPKMFQNPTDLGARPVGAALPFHRGSRPRGGGGMKAIAPGEIVLFEGFRLDRRGLFRRDEGGAFVPVAIGSRGLDVLGVLIARLGDLVLKDEIVAAVWPGMVVEDSNLTVQISAVRRVLDHGRSGGSCIQTISGRGYRFVPT